MSQSQLGQSLGGGGGGGGSVGGSTGAVQFHDGSGFGGSSSLIWDNTLKRLGVGSSSPSTTIHAAGAFSSGTAPYIRSEDTTSTGALIEMYASQASGAGYLQTGASTDIRFAPAGSTKMLLEHTTGNLGLGVTEPSTKLHLAATEPTIRLEDTNDSLDFDIRVDGNGFNIREASDSDAYRFVINGSTGNCGIGTSSPSYPLEIADGTPEVALEDTSSGGSFRLKLDGVAASINNYSSNGNLTFGTTGTGDFVFDTGNVGIGTSSPSAPIHVSGATNDGNSLSEFTQTGTGRGLSVLRNVESATRQMVSFAQTHASGGSQPVVHIQQADSDEIALGIDTSGTVSSPTFSVKGNGEVFTDGNVGIGTSSPSQKLQIKGSNDTDYLSILLNSSSDSSKAIYGVEGNTAGTLCTGTVARAAVMASTSSGAALQLGTAGVIRATFDSSGNCAIGHSSPDTILHTLTSSDWVGKFESSDSYAAIILEDNSSTHNGNRVGVTGDNLHFTTAGTERMRIDASGNLGIGSSSPSGKLEVNTGSGIAYFTRTAGDDGSTNPALGIAADSTKPLIRAYGDGLVFETAAVGGTASERMRIDSGGNVRVGNGSTITASTDADDLVIDKGAGDTGLSILSTTTGRIYFGDAANEDAGSIRYVHTDDSMRFETDDTERMRIQSDGTVHLPSSSTETLLKIDGNSATTKGIRIKSENAGGIIYAANSSIAALRFGVTADDSSITEAARFDSQGRLGLGTTVPNEKLVVSGNCSVTGALQITSDTSVPSAGAALYRPASNELGLVTASTERMRIASTGRVTVKKSSNAEVTALTDGATITPDLDDANNFSVTLGGNRTLANPSNCTAGQSGIITITQDGTGSRTLAYGAYWKFSGGTAPTLTTTASAVDVLAYYVESATRITATLISDTK